MKRETDREGGVGELDKGGEREGTEREKDRERAKKIGR